jgi:predicted RNase H-like HicB family nuclease
MAGYVVVFEGDDDCGFSAYSPAGPGVVAAGETRAETEVLMREALSEHLAILRDSGLPVPDPSDATIVEISAA